MKTPIIVTLAATLVAVAVILGVIVITGHDPSTYLLALTGVIPSLGVLFGVNQLTKKTETIQSNTNGTLTAMREESAKKDAQILALTAQLPPDTATAALTTPTADVAP